MVKVVDLETTGLKDSSEIAQLAIMTLDDRFNIVSFNNSYFAISEEMPEQAFKANKLSKQFLQEASRGIAFNNAKEEILKELQGHTLVAHNADFEKRLLGYHLDHALDNNEWICTMLRYTPTLAIVGRNGVGYKNCNLRELTQYAINEAGITEDRLNSMYERCTGRKDTFHNSLYDVFCTSLALKILG